MADEADEESVYEESREDLVEDDEISPEEDGFMMGYDEADHKEETEVDDSEEEPKENSDEEEEIIEE